MINSPFVELYKVDEATVAEGDESASRIFRTVLIARPVTMDQREPVAWPMPIPGNPYPARRHVNGDRKCPTYGD
jgi:hypothetical protein